MVAVLLAIQLKGGRAEYGFLINLAAGIFLFFCIVGKLEVFIRAVEQIQSFLTLDTEYIAIMLKMVGITYIAQFSSGICKDAGYQAIAAQIEIFGKLAILVVGMPVLLALWKQFRSFCYEKIWDIRHSLFEPVPVWGGTYSVCCRRGRKPADHTGRAVG